MTDDKGKHALSDLYRIVEASEKGHATVAAVMPDPGLKVLFQSYAHQRAQFRAEILAELRRLDHKVRPGASVPGMIHRGRVAIFAAMAIDKTGQEKVVLKEAAFGEKVALRAYQRALAQDLSVETRQVIARQMEAVRKVGEQVNLLRGQNGRRLIARLFNAERDAGKAVQLLRLAGFAPAFSEMIPVTGREVQRSRGATVLETILSGAVGGALWGGLAGILVGSAVAQPTLMQPGGLLPALGAWLLLALSFLLLGVLIASVLALFIGLSIAEDDRYQAREVLTSSQYLVRTVTDQARAGEADQILQQAWELSRSQAV